MERPELWTLSLQAFTAVIAVLGVLAVIVEILGRLAPAAPRAPHAPPPANVSLDPAPAPASQVTDAATHAAVLAASREVARRYVPGSEVVRIEEVAPGRPVTVDPGEHGAQRPRGGAS